MNQMLRMTNLKKPMGTFHSYGDTCILILLPGLIRKTFARTTTGTFHVSTFQTARQPLVQSKMSSWSTPKKTWSCSTSSSRILTPRGSRRTKRSPRRRTLLTPEVCSASAWVLAWSAVLRSCFTASSGYARPSSRQRSRKICTKKKRRRRIFQKLKMNWKTSVQIINIASIVILIRWVDWSSWK